MGDGFGGQGGQDSLSETVASQHDDLDLFCSDEVEELFRLDIHQSCVDQFEDTDGGAVEQLKID